MKKHWVKKEDLDKPLLEQFELIENGLVLIDGSLV